MADPDLVDNVSYSFLFPICGSHKILFVGTILSCKISIAFFATLNPPVNPFNVTTLKSSNDVWYSLYLPNFVLQITAIGKSIPGELYCRSSEALSKNEYFLNLILSFLYAYVKALSVKELVYVENMHE